MENNELANTEPLFLEEIRGSVPMSLRSQTLYRLYIDWSILFYVCFSLRNIFKKYIVDSLTSKWQKTALYLMFESSLSNTPVFSIRHIAFLCWGHFKQQSHQQNLWNVKKLVWIYHEKGTYLHYESWDKT